MIVPTSPITLLEGTWFATNYGETGLITIGYFGITGTFLVLASIILGTFAFIVFVAAIIAAVVAIVVAVGSRGNYGGWGKA